jgi:hypothetical protein
MTIPQFLTLSSFTNVLPGNAELFISTGQTYFNYATLSGGVGTIEDGNSSNQTYVDGFRVVRFKNGFYVSCGSSTSGEGGIFRSLDNGATWTRVFRWVTALPNGFGASLNNGVFQHLHVININGVPTLCYNVDNTGGNAYYAKSTDGTTWTAATIVLPGGFTTQGSQNDTIVGTTVYYTPSQAGATTHIWYIDFSATGAGRLGLTTNLSASYGCGAFCYFNGKLYHARFTSGSASSTTTNLYEIDKSFATLVATITHPTGHPSSNFSSPNDTVKWDMFTDGINMYLFHAITAGSGASGAPLISVYQFDSALAVTDITATVLPTYFDSGSTNGNMILRILVDQVTNPASPQYFLFSCTDAGNVYNIPTPWVVWKWNGNASLMTLEGSVGQVTDKINFGAHRSQGSPFFSQNSLGQISPHVEILGRATQANGTIFIQFSLYSQTGAQTLKVRGFFADLATQEYSVSAATLLNPSHGTMNGAYIENLIGDNGATIYQVTWNAPTDGITSGDTYSFNLETQVQ